MKTENGLERVKSVGIVAWACVGVIITIGVALYVLSSLRAVIMPFLYAMAIVYILRPVVNYLDDKGMPRIIALLLTYLGILVALTLSSMYVGPILYRESNSLISKIPEYIANVGLYINDFIASHHYFKGSGVTRFIIGVQDSITSFARRAALYVPTFTVSLFGGVLNLILAPIIAFYVLKDFSVLRTTINEMIPERHRAEGMEIIRKIDCIVGGFLKGQAMVALIVGLLSGVGLWVIGVDYAILLGFIIGFFNILPYLGPIIGGAPAVLIALGTSWQLALITVLVLIAIQQFDSTVISPRIMSRQVNLHPVVVIFAILAGGTLFGFIGMLIAIPIAAVGKALYLHFRERDSAPGAEESAACPVDSKT
ncbi:MAG: AI-2E family transporter [Actinobacteria bacterium]|nr:AI-2E family transporter [Actinomycetota bacterium]